MENLVRWHLGLDSLLRLVYFMRYGLDKKINYSNVIPISTYLHKTEKSYSPTTLLFYHNIFTLTGVLLGTSLSITIKLLFYNSLSELLWVTFGIGGLSALVGIVVDGRREVLREINRKPT